LVFIRAAASSLMSGGRGRFNPSLSSYSVASTPGVLPISTLLAVLSGTSAGTFTGS
jgi:hypothetical protein